MIRSFFHRLARALFSERQLRVLRHPALLPASYRPLIDEVESIRDLQRTGQCNDDECRAAFVRKCAHIIDKGLQRRDFEPGHSERWYRAACEAMAAIAPQTLMADPSLRWASAKLREYELRQQSPDISLASDATREPDADENENETLRRIIKSRRSVRTFTTRPVDDQTLRSIVETVNWAPSSCNRQPAKVFIASDPSLVNQCLATCAGATCFSGDAPSFACFAADLRVYDLPEEMLCPELDIGLGVQNCLLAAHGMGMGAALLSWARHTAADDAALRRLLNIAPYYRIIVNAVIGWPDAAAPVPLRKPVDATCVFRASEGRCCPREKAA